MAFDRDTYGNNIDDRNEEEDEVDEVSDDSDCISEEEEQNEEYQSKATRTPYSPSIMDSHNPDFTPMEHKYNPNHCNDCMQKYLEQQLIAKDYEQQQQQMSRDYSSQEDILSSLRGVSWRRLTVLTFSKTQLTVTLFCSLSATSRHQ